MIKRLSTLSKKESRRIKKMNKPEPVFVRELSREKMIDGNEKFFTKVIDNGMIKDWVGFGWVADVPAIRKRIITSIQKSKDK
jgi:hypothetical protein